MKNELFIGITTWNDAKFLPYCLDSVKRTLSGIDYKICITDNGSQDDTLEIARTHTEDIRVGKEPQADALNYLISKSQGRRTLLIHSDVILLGMDWYQCCGSSLERGAVLVSPEDIGCGNYEREFGAGMPESSFMLFDTEWLRSARRIHPRRLLRRIMGKSTGGVYDFDFYGEHITHNIPGLVRKTGETWSMMKVHPSARHEMPLHASSDSRWMGDAAYRTYGFGNFYSLNGKVTHYHNWFARWESLFGEDTSKWGIPASMIKSYSMKFIEDYENDRIELPIECA